MDGKFTVHHNGDYSGDVRVQIPTYHPSQEYSARVVFYNNSDQRDRFAKLLHTPEDLIPDFYEVDIPFDLMKQIVADKLRMDYIERFEQMTSDEVLSYAFINRKL
jgi:hypothetical protein